MAAQNLIEASSAPVEGIPASPSSAGDVDRALAETGPGALRSDGGIARAAVLRGVEKPRDGVAAAGRWRPADVAAFLDEVPRSSRPDAKSSDPYAYLDLEPDFAWHSADGSARVIPENGERPAWVVSAERKRRRHRLVSAASWLVSGAVAMAIFALAAVMMLGVPRTMALLNELTGDGIAPSAPAVVERAAGQQPAGIATEPPALGAAAAMGSQAAEGSSREPSASSSGALDAEAPPQKVVVEQ